MKTWKLFTTSDGGISAEGPEISIDLEVEVIEKSAYDELLRAAAILAIDLRAATQMESLGLKSLRDFEALIERHVGGTAHG